MDGRHYERVGVIVASLWIEAAHESPLRARITRSGDPADPSQDYRSVALVATADEACEVVCRWLHEFVTSR